MGRGARIEQALRDVIDLRRVRTAAQTAEQRLRIDRVLHRRFADLDLGVPKTQAARVLGISVNALEKWIARGTLPMVPRPGSRRLDIETSAFLALADTVEELRSTGESKRLLTQAFARLQEVRAARPAMGTRGYFPDHARERRLDFERLNVGERVAEAMRLSRAVTRIAAAGAKARR